MSAALGVVYIITKAQYILMELIDILEGYFYGNVLAFSGKVKNVRDSLL